MKIAMWTDQHWGAKGNSKQHNDDCLDYMQWFIDNVKRLKCDTLVFMGDWFENRNAINVGTLNASFRGLQMVNELGLPIYFCIGNHDLYHRGNRAEFSTYHFSQFSNIILVNEPHFSNDLAFFPYIFNSEYPEAVAQIMKNKSKYVFGHFEFRNFIVTGSDRRIEHGPDHTAFSAPDYIFSGHFHKRQMNDNVIYIGNTFPTNYGDAWDDARGMATLDTDTGEIDFINWEDCPKYRKVKLSDVLSGTISSFPPKCRVRCTIDVDIAYSDAQALREELAKELQLREFSLEENTSEKRDALENDEDIGDFDLSSLNNAVVQMLETGVTGTSTINAQKLIKIYEAL